MPQKPPKNEQNTKKREKPTISKHIANIADTAAKIATGAKGVSIALGKALLNSPEQLKNMQETGIYLKELREIAGLTRKELSQAIKLADENLLAAVENGTATLSFELVLRLSSLLARHDPVPFTMRFIRTYNPDIVKILESWGLDKIPIQLERERQFINIYRSQDSARNLNDEEFKKILQFTKSSFDMALHFTSKSSKNTP